MYSKKDRKTVLKVIICKLLAFVPSFKKNGNFEQSPISKLLIVFELSWLRKLVFIFFRYMMQIPKNFYRFFTHKIDQSNKNWPFLPNVMRHEDKLESHPLGLGGS